MTYCYTTEDGKTTVEQQFPMGAAKKRITLPDGRKAFRDLSAEHLSGRRTKDPWVDHLSTALGCAPNQRKDFSKQLKDHGVPTDFHPDGRCKVTSTEHQRKIMRVRGMSNQDSYY